MFHEVENEIEGALVFPGIFFEENTYLWIIYCVTVEKYIDHFKLRIGIWNPHLKSIASCLSVTISLNWEEFESKLL